MKQLPHFNPQGRFLVSGKTLNLIAAAIVARTPLAGAGLEAQKTPAGVIIKRER